MNTGLGVYDVFSRIVPGGLYLFTFVQFAMVMNWFHLDWKPLIDPGILPSLSLLLVAYVLGIAMDRLGSAWMQLFKQQSMKARFLQKFKQRHADHWNFDFADKDLQSLRAYIRIHSPGIANEIDRNNALRIMLRNLSLGLSLLAFCEIIQMILTRNWSIAALIALLIFLSYQLAIQARGLQDWFYSSIFETILAYRLDLEERVKSAKMSTKRSNAK